MAKTTIEKVIEVFERTESKELHVNEIADHIQRIYPSDFVDIDDAKTKVNGALAANVKSKKPLFRKIKGKKKGTFKKGLYALKRIRTKSIDFQQHIEDVTKQNTGRGGEFAVISELIFLGHNATLLPVDSGIDVISTKNEKFFHIQVKTKLCKSNDKAVSFTIKKTAYESNRRSHDYYVFVLRRAIGAKWQCDYIVLHAHQLEAADEKATTSLTVKFEWVNNRIMFGNVDVTSSFNNFAKIR